MLFGCGEAAVSEAWGWELLSGAIKVLVGSERLGSTGRWRR